MYSTNFQNILYKFCHFFQNILYKFCHFLNKIYSWETYEPFKGSKYWVEQQGIKSRIIISLFQVLSSYWSNSNIDFLLVYFKCWVPIGLFQILSSHSSILNTEFPLVYFEYWVPIGLFWISRPEMLIVTLRSDPPREPGSST